MVRKVKAWAMCAYVVVIVVVVLVVVTATTTKLGLAGQKGRARECSLLILLYYYQIIPNNFWMQRVR